MERGVLLATGPVIGHDDLPRSITELKSGRPKKGRSAEIEPQVLEIDINELQKMPLRKARREILSAFEKTYLSKVLRSARGRVGDAARHAGINERSLYELMRNHGLRKEDYKGP